MTAEDGPCGVPSCPTCELEPRPGEDRGDWLRRIGAPFRAEAGVAEMPARETAPCPWCGAPVPPALAGKRRVFCNGRCRDLAYQERRRRTAG